MPSPPINRAAAVCAIAALGACASSTSPPAAPASAAAAPGEAALYELRFAGHLIGSAEQKLRRREATAELVRRERILFRRGGELVHQELELRIVGQPWSRATLVELRQHDCTTGSLSPASAPPPASDSASDSDSISASASISAPASASASVSAPASASASVSISAPASVSPPWPPPCPSSHRTTLARAERHPDGWDVETLTGRTRLPAAAEPTPWLELWLRPPTREAAAPPPTHHLVFLPGRAFALGDATARWLSPSTWLGTLTLGGATLAATTELDADGLPLATVDDTGLTALRVAASPPPPRQLADLVALSSLSVRGEPSSRLRLLLERAAAPPPTLPGQRVRAHGARWDLELVPQEWAPDVAPIAALVAAIADDDPQARRGQRASDCTAYALRFAAAARARGWRVRLVTGLALDGATLVRHRWALVHTGTRWLTVDPAAGQAPAEARLLALAVHDASAAALAGADATFSALARADVRFLAR